MAGSRSTTARTAARSTRPSRRAVGVATVLTLTCWGVAGYAPGQGTARADHRGPAPACAPLDPGDGSGSGDPTEVVIWHATSNMPETVFDEHLEAFHDQRDDVIVTTETDTDWDARGMLRALAATDDLPDIVIINETATAALAASGMFMLPGACDDAGGTGNGGPAEGLLPVVAATYSIDGQLRAVPYGVSTPILVFNSAKVAAAGLDPDEPPLKLAELRAASDTVRDSGVAEHGLVVTDHFSRWALRQFTAQRGELIAEPANGRTAAPIERLMFTTPTIIADFEWMRSGLFDDSFLWFGGDPSGFGDLLELRTGEGTAAYTIASSAILGDVLALLEAGAFPGSEIGVGPMPGYGGGLVGGNALWVVDHGDPHRAAAAWEVVNYLTAPARIAELAARTGYVPTTTAAAEHPVIAAAWETYPELRVAYDQLAAMDESPASAGLAMLPSVQLEWELYELTSRLRDPAADVAAELADLESRFMAVLATLPPPTTTVTPP